MKLFSEFLSLQTEKLREYRNITSEAQSVITPVITPETRHH
jgi:hypothetical protein